MTILQLPSRVFDQLSVTRLSNHINLIVVDLGVLNEVNHSLLSVKDAFPSQIVHSESFPLSP